MEDTETYGDQRAHRLSEHTCSKIHPESLVCCLFTIKHFLEPLQGSDQRLTGFGFISGFVLLWDKSKEKKQQQWSSCVAVSSLCKPGPSRTNYTTPLQREMLTFGCFALWDGYVFINQGRLMGVWMHTVLRSPLQRHCWQETVWLAPAALSLWTTHRFRPPSNQVSLPDSRDWPLPSSTLY